MGGKMATTTVEGRRRFSVLVRYARDYPELISTTLKRVLVMTPSGASGSDRASWHGSAFDTGPPMYRDENGRLTSVVYVDTASRDLLGFVRSAQVRVRDRVAPLRGRPSNGPASTSSRCTRGVLFSSCFRSCSPRSSSC